MSDLDIVRLVPYFILAIFLAAVVLSMVLARRDMAKARREQPQARAPLGVDTRPVPKAEIDPEARERR